jgi:hypothetical protein
MTADELNHAASALASVFWEEFPDAELPDEFWELFPDRGIVSRKRVARISESVREILNLGRFGGDSQAFWAWVAERRAYAKDWQLQPALDKAAAEYSKALLQTFVLDSTYGDAYDSERRAGRVLHDAERRLDRQVTQALADFESARGLRV